MLYKNAKNVYNNFEKYKNGGVCLCVGIIPYGYNMLYEL